jgi:hypothetical protein
MVIAIAVGGSLGLLERWRARPRRVPHRGRVLRTAISSKNLDTIAAALFNLRPHVTDEQRAIIDTVEHIIDHARFGGGSIDHLAEVATPLFEVA